MKPRLVFLILILVAYARDPNDGIRRCAIAALGPIGAQDDLPLIRPCLTARHRAVQTVAKDAEEGIRSRSSSLVKLDGREEQIQSDDNTRG
jgi:HEAT repeat protein